MISSSPAPTRHSESNLHLQRTVNEFLWLQKLHLYILAVYVPICVAIVVFSCIWSNIFGKSGEYSDLSSDWQACMIQADIAIVPLQSLISQGQAATKQTVTTCITDEFLVGSPPPCDFSSYGCVTSIASVCLQSLSVSIPNISLPTGHFLQTLSYVGVQSIVFSAVAHASLNRALRHPSWLVSTIGGLVWLLYSVLTFYTINPAYPVPNQTNGTILTLLYYGASYTKYSHFNNGDNNCGPAFRNLWGYLTLILLIAVSVLLALLIAIYAETVRYKRKNRPHYEPLQHAALPCALAALAVVFYLLIAVSKIGASINELVAIAKYFLTQAQAVAQGRSLWYEQVFFPFVTPSLDIASILFIVVFTSILRGYTIQSISAYRLAAVSAGAFCIVSYPAVVGAFQFYYYNDFQDYDSCWNYFLGSSTGFFGYPDENEAKFFCQMFRLSLTGYCGLFALMHFIAVACLHTSRVNAHRDSEVLEPLEQMQERLSAVQNSKKEVGEVRNPITTSVQSSSTLGQVHRGSDASSLAGKPSIVTAAEAVYVGDRMSVDRQSEADRASLASLAEEAKARQDKK